MNIQHFINISEYSRETLLKIIHKGIALKEQCKNGIYQNSLSHKTLAMIFDKASTRTRVSFEVGMSQLGGRALFLSNNDTQLGRGETIEDSSKVISSMVDIIMLRISNHSDMETFAQYSTKPVINALSDESHPCQLLADMMTIVEHGKSLDDLTIAWIGDGNNMANTYAQAANILGFNLHISSPKGYVIDSKYLNDNVTLFTSPSEAVTGVDIISTDVFTSMGQEADRVKRLAAFKDFEVNSALTSHAKDDYLFMHCLPAHRGEEVSAEVMDGKHSVVFDQAENRLHAQKALLLYLTNNL